MNYLEALPLHVHQQILELNGIKDSLYIIKKGFRDKYTFVEHYYTLYNPSIEKYQPSFLCGQPKEYKLYTTRNLKDGYIKVGNKMWFNGFYTIYARTGGGVTAFHLEEKSNNYLINVCKAIKFNDRCTHCSKNFVLELGNDGFTLNKKKFSGYCMCDGARRMDVWGVDGAYHEKCKDKYTEIECGCFVHKECLTKCKTCDKIQCCKHGCQKKCKRCREIKCKNLMCEYRDKDSSGFLCEDCVVYCSHCSRPTMDHKRCKKCERRMCRHCSLNLMNINSNCIPCYKSLLRYCKSCNIKKHEEHFVTCEKCNKKLCRDCIVERFESLSIDYDSIVDFDMRDVCADCIVEELL